MSDATATFDPLLPEIEAFLKASGMTPTTFGKATQRDPMLVWDLRQGRELRIATRKKVREWMARQADQVSA